MKGRKAQITEKTFTPFYIATRDCQSFTITADACVTPPIWWVRSKTPGLFWLSSAALIILATISNSELTLVSCTTDFSVPPKERNPGCLNSESVGDGQPDHNPSLAKHRSQMLTNTQSIMGRRSMTLKAYVVSHIL